MCPLALIPELCHLQMGACMPQHAALQRWAACMQAVCLGALAFARRHRRDGQILQEFVWPGVVQLRESLSISMQSNLKSQGQPTGLSPRCVPSSLASIMHVALQALRARLQRSQAFRAAHMYTCHVMVHASLHLLCAVQAESASLPAAQGRAQARGARPGARARCLQQHPAASRQPEALTGPTRSWLTPPRCAAPSCVPCSPGMKT